LDSYKKRLLDSTIKEYFKELPALSIDGAKAVGKTATASRYAKHIMHLDIEEGLDVIAGGLDVLSLQPKPLLIDEWQRFPRSWDYIRRLVDTDNSPGQYLLTGSAIPRKAQTHSGAGRIVRLRMRPLSLEERDIETPAIRVKDLLNGSVDQVSARSELSLVHYIREVTASGFPGMRALSENIREAQLDSYLSNLTEHEFPESGTFVRKPDILQGWLRAYAAATASTASYQEILDASTPGESQKPSKATTLTYRDTLDSLWMTDRVPAWLPSTNPFAALSKGPKHFLADPALAARLLRLSADKLISGTARPLLKPKAGAAIGRLFEALIALSLQTYAQVNQARLYHFRSAKGDKEIDFIIERGLSLVAVEVKSSPEVTASDVRHLNWLAENCPDYDIACIVVTTGQNAYTRPDGIHVIPATLLGA